MGEAVVLIAIVAIIVGLYMLRIGKHKDKEQESSYNDHQNDSTGDNYAFEIMKESLGKLGCQPKVTGEDTMEVAYQGETFCINCSGLYARIWDPAWTVMRADDPELPKVRAAVNLANYEFGPTIVTTKPNEDNIIAFHSRMDIMIHPYIPGADDYVRATLNSFFHIKDALKAEYQNINTQQQEKQKKRRTIGFLLSDDEDKNSPSEEQKDEA